MKLRSIEVQWKTFVAVLVACGLIALMVSWFTGLNFWILFLILIGALLVNAIVAHVEDTQNWNNDN